MKTKIQIGLIQTGQKPAVFDLATLIKTRLLICANSGGGKSWLLRLMAEQLFGTMPVIIFDVEGEFATLRDKFDFVLVGPGGETPADCRSAKLVMEKLLELRASAVIDLSELEPREKHRYVRLASEAAINSPKHLWRPTCFIFDEAHEFCPENGKGESEAKSAVLAFATKGRKRQFLSIYATQRVHKLALDLRAECLNRLIGMTFEPDDLKVAASILGISGKDGMGGFNRVMRTMEEGYFYGFGRALCLEPQMIVVGKVQTRHGKPNTVALKPPPTPENIKKLLPKLADLPALAEEKAMTEKELREQITGLKRELRDAKSSVPAVPAAKVKIEKTNVLVLKPEHVKLVRETAAKQETILKACAKLTARIGDDFATLNRLTGVLDDAQKIIEDHKNAPALPTKQIVPITPKIFPNPNPAPMTPPQLRSRQPFEPSADSNAGKGEWRVMKDDGLKQGEIRVLTAIAQVPAGVTAEHISLLTGYKSTSRKEYLRQLRSKGLIQDIGEYVRATEAGIAALGSNYKTLPTGVDLIEHYLRELSGGEKKIFEYVIGHGDVANDEALEQATGYKATSRKEYIRMLRARHILIEAGNGRYKLAENFTATIVT